MRKIDQETKNAFWNDYNLKNNNTKVEYLKTSENNNNAPETRIYLHGNCIAKKIYGEGIFLNHCGWMTVTTKARLNALLDPKDKIYQKDFIWYWKNGIKFNDGWNKL